MRIANPSGRIRWASSSCASVEESSKTVVARYVDTSQVECVTPASSAVGSRRVGVSLTGQQSSSSGVEFTYVSSAAVSSVWPPSGAAEGGTPVTVLGSGFSSAAEASGSLRCRFNATSVGAAYVSESVVACNTTASAAGLVVVEVSTNGREYTSSGVHFELVSLDVQGVAPWSGPALGGTVVTIAGSRLAHAAEAEVLRCRFGGGVDASSAASAHGSDGVRCVSPSALPTGWSSVELSMHGTALRSGGSLYVHAAVYASALVPPAGPVAGGTRVSVLGAGFREVATLRCRFEGSGATSAARRVGVNQLECATPSSTAAGARRLGLSANGQQFAQSDGIFFTYRPVAAVSSVWPTRGASEGGTPVTVLGSGFSSAAEAMGALLCRFDTSIVSAAYVSESAIVCNSTRSSRGYMAVEVSTNGREYTSDGVQFEQQGDALQALAFELAAHPSCSDDPAIRAELAYHLAAAAGGRGMVLGQAEDIAAETADVPLDLAAITGLQGRKTGALFHWSATVGPRMAKADIAPLGRYANALGLAFQIADDILDVEGDSGKAGMRLQKDGAAGKATFVSLLGLDAAKRRARDLVAEAHAALEVYGNEGDTLRQAAQFVIARDT
mgnify:CR=1 FL=1